MLAVIGIWERKAQGQPSDDPRFYTSGHTYPIPPEGFEPPRICRGCGSVFFPLVGSRSEVLPAPTGPGPGGLPR